MKKAQSFGALLVLISLVCFGLIYYGGLATVVNTVGVESVRNSNTTGIEAFFFSNVNIIITVFFIAALLFVGRMAAG